MCQNNDNQSLRTNLVREGGFCKTWRFSWFYYPTNWTVRIATRNRQNCSVLYAEMYHHSSKKSFWYNVRYQSVALSTSSMYFNLQEGMTFLLTPNKLKVTRFPDWMSSGSLSSAPDSSWHIAVTHCKASAWADLMQSTRPKRKRRVDALSYVATSLWYSLHKQQQTYYCTTITFDIAQHFKYGLHIK